MSIFRHPCLTGIQCSTIITGNNTFGDDIPILLAKLGQTEERSAYILMERIHPPHLKNYGLKAGEPPVLADFISELGIYGVLVGYVLKICVPGIYSY